MTCISDKTQVSHMLQVRLDYFDAGIHIRHSIATWLKASNSLFFFLRRSLQTLGISEHESWLVDDCLYTTSTPDGLHPFP